MRNLWQFLLVGVVILLVWHVLSGVEGQGEVNTAPEAEMSSAAAGDGQMLLQVPLEKTIGLRGKFTEEFKQQRTFVLLDFYNGWIDKIGANGIINVIQGLDPSCHDTAHDLGKLIYQKTGDVGTSLLTCENSCNSGCMHGVLMGFFQEKGLVSEEGGEDHVYLEDVKDQISGICGDVGKEGNSTMAQVYRQGDCVHGVGHAVMYLSNYDIGQAIEYCSLFDSDVLDYYCATGAYMEYNTNYGQKNIADGWGWFFPCDQTDYPAACFRYKMAHVVPMMYREGGTLKEMQDACLELDGKYELGCFHGLGNGHYGPVVRGMVNLKELCAAGNEEDQYVCIEGLIERMARYVPKLAEQQCALMDGWQKDLCMESFERELYDLEKPFELYVR